MKCVIDDNVILPLILSQHPHRRIAAKWWKTCPDEGAVLTLPVRMGVRRLLTNRTLMRDGVMTPESAWQILGELAAYAEARGWEMLTFDSGYRRFRLSHLTVLGE